MKTFIKKSLSLVLACSCIFSTTACGKKECSHTYVSTITKEATCKEVGIETYTCTTCGNSFTENISKTNEHSYKSKISKESTCEQSGIITYTCTICEDTYSEEIEKQFNCSFEYIYDNLGHVATCKWCKKSNGKQDHELDTYNKCPCGYKLNLSNLSFSIAPDGKSYIVSSGRGSNIIIPQYYNGMPISGIKSYAFKETSVKDIKIYAKITEIPYAAFQSCKSLENIKMPESIIKIDHFAFSGCIKLFWSNQLPKNLEFIGGYAFQECPIFSMTIPKSVNTICSGAFEDAWGFKNIRFEDTNGWTADGVPIKLSNEGSTNFDLLTTTYCYRLWKKV